MKTKSGKSTLIFSTVSIIGKVITLSSDVWDNHIVPGHPEMKNEIENVKSALEDPERVAKSASKPQTSEVYFGASSSENLFVKVVTERTSDSTGKVVTAFMQKGFRGTMEGTGIIYERYKKPYIPL